MDSQLCASSGSALLSEPALPLTTPPFHPSTAPQLGTSYLRDSTTGSSVTHTPCTAQDTKGSRGSGRNHQALYRSQTDGPLGKTGLIKKESSPSLVIQPPFQLAKLGSRGRKQASPSPTPHPKLTVHPLAPSRAQTRHLPPSSSSTQSCEKPSKCTYSQLQDWAPHK